MFRGSQICEGHTLALKIKVTVRPPFQHTVCILKKLKGWRPAYEFASRQDQTGLRPRHARGKANAGQNYFTDALLGSVDCRTAKNVANSFSTSPPLKDLVLYASRGLFSQGLARSKYFSRILSKWITPQKIVMKCGTGSGSMKNVISGWQRPSFGIGFCSVQNQGCKTGPVERPFEMMLKLVSDRSGKSAREVASHARDLQCKRHPLGRAQIVSLSLARESSNCVHELRT